MVLAEQSVLLEGDVVSAIGPLGQPFCRDPPACTSQGLYISRRVLQCLTNIVENGEVQETKMAGQGLSLQPEFKTTSGPSAASGLTQQEDIADLAGLSATGKDASFHDLAHKIPACACTCSMSACFACLYFSQAAPNSWRSPLQHRHQAAPEMPRSSAVTHHATTERRDEDAARLMRSTYYPVPCSDECNPALAESPTRQPCLGAIAIRGDIRASSYTVG